MSVYVWFMVVVVPLFCAWCVLRAVSGVCYRGVSLHFQLPTKLRAIIEEGRSHGRRIYCSFVDFRKAFDTVPRERLMRRLQEMGVPIEMTWGIMALYRSVREQVRTPEGLSDVVHSTIGVKQGCPLSPTLFGMYVDEISDYIERGGDRGAQLAFLSIGWDVDPVVAIC